MREIKFRGKILSGAEWIYGGYYKREEKDKIIHFIIDDSWKEETGSMSRWILDAYEVIPETIGQFTGLHDSTKWEDLTEKERSEWTKRGNMPSEWRGRDIYEGDICKIPCIIDGNYRRFPKDYIGQVVYAGCSFHLIDAGVEESKSIQFSGIEVIGNIHCNPELLE